MNVRMRWMAAAAGIAAAAGAGEPAVNPVLNAPMRYGDETRLGRPFSKDPSVIRLGDRYLMYFSLPPFATNLAPANAPKGWSIGIAESRDLVRWTKVAEMRPEQECDRNGLCAPGARVLDGRVHLVYQTYGNGPRDAICHAVSDDGVTFKRHAANPVFRPSGAWTSGRAIDAEIFPHDGRLLLYFATRDPSMTTQMVGVAAADITSDLGPAAWKLLRDGPVLAPELPWERKCIEAPTILHRDGKLFMFYAGGYNNEPQQIGCAVSEDGVKWKRVSDEPLIPNGAPGDWNASESGHPGVFRDIRGTDSRAYLFFQANNDRGKTWFLSCARIGFRDERPVVMPYD